MSEIIPEKYHDLLLSIGTYAQKLGLKAWVVGGAVRDFYIGRDTMDIDLTFDGTQESVANFCIKMWGGVKRKFSKFGTYKVNLDNGLHLDLARLRYETYAHPGALPDVIFTKDVKQDLFRRDFTVNAWALSILPDEFGKSVDPYGAKKDIDTGLIRVLHKKSFLDDPTRMYRGVRFAGRFGWRAAPITKQLFLEADREQAPLLVSRERFSQEFLKILNEDKIKPIFDYLIEYDLLKFVWPSLKWHDGLLTVRDMYERLGLLVCTLGDNGEEFLRSMHTPKEIAHVLKETWKVEQERMSPLAPLTDFQLRILRVFFPQLPPMALQSCVVRGMDLKNAGVYGRNIAKLLVQIRKGQWEGKITTRQQAMALANK